LSHIYNKSNKELKLCHETADISYELTGNELTALLLESAEIKRIFPKYNRSQKKNNPTYGISSYVDRKGVIHLLFDRLSVLKAPIVKFYSKAQCRKFLEELCESNALCPKYCSLQHTSGACFHYHIKQCRGVCRNDEKISDYNKRVKAVLHQLEFNAETYIIKEKGRTADEEAIIYIKNGIYQGFSFIDFDMSISTFSDYEKQIILKPDNSETQRILRSYLNSNQNLDLLRPPIPN
jgi:DNA polymerase-3 subunit epsilon